MPTRYNPVSSCSDNYRMVHLQCCYSCSAAGGFTDYVYAICTPLEMAVPFLFARVEQTYPPPSEVINGVSLHSFELITRSACHHKFSDADVSFADSGIICSIDSGIPEIASRVWQYPHRCWASLAIRSFKRREILVFFISESFFKSRTVSPIRPLLAGDSLSTEGVQKPVLSSA